MPLPIIDRSLAHLPRRRHTELRSVHHRNRTVQALAQKKKTAAPKYTLDIGFGIIQDRLLSLQLRPNKQSIMSIIYLPSILRGGKEIKKRKQ